MDDLQSIISSNHYLIIFNEICYVMSQEIEKTLKTWKVKEQKLMKNGKSKAYIDYYRNYAVQRVKYKTFKKYSSKIFSQLDKYICSTIPQYMYDLLDKFVNIEEFNYGEKT